MKKLLFLLFFLNISNYLIAQDFNVPENVKLEKKEDYAPFKQDVVKAVNWLANTPVNEQTAKRKEVNKFLLIWLSGSPDVHIEIKPQIVTFMNGAPDYLMMFMGGWAKYSITSGNKDDKIEGTLAGLEELIAFYTKNKKHVPKSKEIEVYIKMKKKGTLKEYVEKNA